MFRRKQPAQNPDIAKHMRGLFAAMSPAERGDPQLMAKKYGQYFYGGALAHRLARSQKRSRAHFHIGFEATDGDFATLTKRSALVAETLLLSHRGTGSCHSIFPRRTTSTTNYPVGANLSLSGLALSTRESTSAVYMTCRDLNALGQWITDAEPLLKSGLAWYMPDYWVDGESTVSPRGPGASSVRTIRRDESHDIPSYLDFLVQDGKVVGEFDASPVASQVVRPVLRIDLPFVDGVTLRDFSEITVQEFASYAQLRLFLRDAFLGLDDALNAEQSEREMVRIGQRIESEIRGVQSQLTAARRKRAVAVTGATIGTVGATLVAVYGPAFNEALAVLGVAGAGGVWGVVQAMADGGPRALRDGQWYYVWALAKKSNTYGL
ncbi:hypothetical protein [Streptomyces lasiicapitis]|uniref:hypothetical protein n=1 Tax=Streptomyces lasiicapitis TaxID=1923961 RepID=UPI0036A9BDC1